MPSQELLADCKVTAVPAGDISNKQLAKLALDRETDVMVCNTDKEALRTWYSTVCAKSARSCRKD